MNPRGAADKGSKYNGHVELILKTYLNNANNLGEVIGKYANEEMKEVLRGKLFLIGCGKHQIYLKHFIS